MSHVRMISLRVGIRLALFGLVAATENRSSVLAQTPDPLPIPSQTPRSSEQPNGQSIYPIYPPTINDVRARKVEIQTVTELLEAGSLEKAMAALDIMAGGRELPGVPEDRKHAITRTFYCCYTNVVILDGATADKVQAAALLRAIARAVPLEKERRTSRIAMALHAMLEVAMINIREDWSELFRTPDDQMERWLVQTALFARLQPTTKR